MSFDALPWGLVIIGGPLLLVLALAWARIRTGQAQPRCRPPAGR